MATLPLMAAPTQAAVSTLVSNTVGSSGSNSFAAQSFTTGDQGATISEIKIGFVSFGGTASVKLRENTASGCPTGITSCPGNLVATFASPSSPTPGLNTFTAPDGVTLDASTTYWVMIHEGVSGSRWDVRLAANNNQSGATNWAIGNSRLTRDSASGNWNTNTANGPVWMEIRGELTTPTLVSADVDGTKLTMRFTDDLNTGSLPAPAAFTVTVDGTGRNVASGGVAIANKKVTLTLASAVTLGQEVKVRYTKPASNPLKNAANVDVETFADQSVLNKTAPVITGMKLVSTPRNVEVVGGNSLPTYGAGQPIVVAVTWSDDVAWDLSAMNAGMRVRLQVGSTNKSAELVTDGATSGTATTLWFSYTAVSGDSDTDGVAVVPPTTGDNKDRVVFLRSGAKLTGAPGSDGAQSNAGVTFATGLSAQSGHRVKGSIAAAANTAPFYDDDDDNMADSTDLGSSNAPSGTLVSDAVVARIKDANTGDRANLRIALAADRPDALDTHTLTSTAWFVRTPHACVLEDLMPALPLNDDNQFENEVTLTATDPDGASVTLSWTLLVSWKCGELVSATVNGATLTLAYDAIIHSTLVQSGAEDHFEVMVDGAAAALAQTNPVTKSDRSLVLTLATAVTRNQVVTVSYQPTQARVRGLVDQPVTNALNVVPESATMTGNVMTVTFSENVALETGGDLTDLPYAFATSGLWWSAGDGGGVPLKRVAPDSAVISGKTVTLTFGSKISASRQAIVTYRSDTAETFGAGLFDEQSTPRRVPAFTGYAVTATTDATTPPRLVSGQVAGNELTLTFDSDLDSSSAPAGHRFYVTATPVDFYRAARSISGTGTATVSGKTATVTLAGSVAEGEVSVLWYRPGTDANPLRGSSSGPKVDGIWKSLIRTRDRTSPTIVDSVLANTSLHLYYSETLDTDSEPEADAFTVMTTGVSPTSIDVSDVTVHPDAVTLTLASAPAGSINVGYAVPGTDPVQDLAGNDAAAISNRTVAQAGTSDPGTPTLATTSPVQADQQVLRLTFNRALDPASVPGADAFTIGGTDPQNGNPLVMTILGVAVRGSKVELAVTPGFLACDSGFTISYTGSGENPLRNAWGTAVDDFRDKAVTNLWSSRCVPLRVQATPMGNAGGNSGPSGNSGADGMRLGFDRSMRRSQTPSPGGFSVRSQTPGGTPAAPVEVESVEFSPDGASLQMALSRVLAPGEQVTVSYQHPRSGPGLWDSDDNQIAPFTAQADVPSAAPTVTAVEVVSDAGVHDTYAMGDVISVRVTFSEAVDVTGSPTLGIDMDPAHWGRKDAIYASGSGTAELTFTHEVIWPNFSTQGIAVLADTLSLNGGTIHSAATGADADLGHTGLGHDADHKVDWRQSPPDAAGNRRPIVTGASDTHNNALPGIWVSLAVSKDDFSDPDGDALTFTLSASRSDVHVSDGFGYMESHGRIWFLAKTACALVELDPPSEDAYYTVFTLTATDPAGASESATATFRTDPDTYSCPSLSSAAVDGATLTISLDDDAAPSFEQPTAGEFAVWADGVAVSLASAGSDAVSVSDTTIELTLASPVSAAQTVTVSYTPGDHPIAAAFADHAVTNNTPVPDEPAALKKPAGQQAGSTAEDDPSSDGPTAPVSAAVSGSELTLTFNRGLAAVEDATARALRWAFLVDGAYHNGTPITNQSPSAVAVHGATVTLTLGTAIAPGNDATVRYFAAAAGNGLKNSDGTPLADFATSHTTTQRN